MNKTNHRSDKISKVLAATATIIFMTSGFSACKKEDVNPSSDIKSGCKIVTAVVQASQPDTIRYTYNADGKVSSIIGDTTTTIFTYSGNTTIVRRFGTKAGLLGKTTITSNAAGLATNVKREFDPAGSVWTNVVYEYSGEELAIATTTDSNGGNAIITYYTWVNHNVVKETTGATSSSYDYYTDKPSQNGDYFSFINLVQGYEFIRVKNLLKTGSGFGFTYSFENDGKISSFTVNGVVTLKYEYDCN